jgi:hypothetical protein
MKLRYTIGIPRLLVSTAVARDSELEAQPAKPKAGTLFLSSMRDPRNYELHTVVFCTLG